MTAAIALISGGERQTRHQKIIANIATISRVTFKQVTFAARKPRAIKIAGISKKRWHQIGARRIKRIKQTNNMGKRQSAEKKEGGKKKKNIKRRR